MDRAQCPSCGSIVGLGTWSDIGDCPACGTPLLLTCEMPVIAESGAATAQAAEREAADRRQPARIR